MTHQVLLACIAGFIGTLPAVFANRLIINLITPSRVCQHYAMAMGPILFVLVLRYLDMAQASWVLCAAVTATCLLCLPAKFLSWLTNATFLKHDGTPQDRPDSIERACALIFGCVAGFIGGYLAVSHGHGGNNWLDLIWLPAALAISAHLAFYAVVQLACTIVYLPGKVLPMADRVSDALRGLRRR